ncbi:predicted protein [Pyrenophora tritici-repentis Pt-1C-BFP]|uniref:Uncharacterized protein n=1 Tax=Pyrenophora tritici-repentis (strain Pt-1C-BFP) TaxID=426418 RepID=B2WCK4_PYRTR|nr:uncharacterized protein PTRG_07713 [Pyrenophora tritici-repentis Pt-1C-BFP]EDU50632.1 predicted protein [Pyrenophora tritici-repentis Pt-1C-BFP]
MAAVPPNVPAVPLNVPAVPQNVPTEPPSAPAVPNCVPVAFPAPENKEKFKFKKLDSTLTMTRDVYQDLYSRGCVDVDPIPAMDLQNEIQTIFRPEAFRNLTAEQYEFIRPALTLASRLITEDAYMEFWVCTDTCTNTSKEPLDPNPKKPGLAAQNSSSGGLSSGASTAEGTSRGGPQTRKKINLGPELGNDWEWWALGSRVPTAAKILETPEDQATTAFSLSNFCHTFQTKTGGKSYYKDCVSHIIRANGREAGRPIHDNLVIVSELGTDVADDDTFNTLQCEIEDYSHAQLVVQGGFEDDKIKPALYGKNKMKSNKQVVQYIDKLLRKEVEARKTKVVKAGKKGTKKTAPISTDKLTTKQEDETKMDESW